VQEEESYWWGEDEDAPVEMPPESASPVAAAREAQTAARENLVKAADDPNANPDDVAEAANALKITGVVYETTSAIDEAYREGLPAAGEDTTEPAGDVEIEMPPDPLNPAAAARVAADAAHDQHMNMYRFTEGLREAHFEVTETQTAAHEALAKAAVDPNADPAAIVDAIDAAAATDAAYEASLSAWSTGIDGLEAAHKAVEITRVVADGTSAIDEAYREGLRAAEEEAANNNAFEGISTEAEASAEVDWF
jgi:hypothetical protein